VDSVKGISPRPPSLHDGNPPQTRAGQCAASKTAEQFPMSGVKTMNAGVDAPGSEMGTDGSGLLSGRQPRACVIDDWSLTGW